MDSSKARERLFEYLDGELDAADLDAFERALDADAALRIDVDRERALEGGIAAVAREERMPDDLWARLRAAVENEAAAPSVHPSAAAAPTVAQTSVPAGPAPAQPVIARPARPGGLVAALASFVAVAAAVLALVAIDWTPRRSAPELVRVLESIHSAPTSTVSSVTTADRLRRARSILATDDPRILPETFQRDGHPVERVEVICPPGEPCVLVKYRCCGQPVTTMVIGSRAGLRARLEAELPPNAIIVEHADRTLSVVYGGHGRLEIAAALGDL